MGKTSVNISIVLLLATLAYVGYYFYSQPASNIPNTATLESMLANTHVFIERRQVLDEVNMDVSLLEDIRFRSLQSFTEPIVEQEVGRPNPFDPVGFSVNEPEES